MKGYELFILTRTFNEGDNFEHFIIDFFELLMFKHHFDNSQDSNFALYNNKKILQIIYS